MEDELDIKINIREERKLLSQEEKVALIIAEKKFGEISPSNLDEIKKYVLNFDIKAEPYKTDAEKYLNESEKKAALNKKEDNTYDRYLVNRYYGLYNPTSKLFDPEKKLEKRDSIAKLSQKMFALDMKSSYAYDDVYYETVDNFYEKYKSLIDDTYIVDKILNKNDYKVKYKEYFKEIYELSRNKGAVKDMFLDYENIIKKTRGYEDVLTGEKYDNGGMNKNELKEFLYDVVKERYNYSKKNSDELRSLFVDANGKVDMDKAIEYVGQKVNRKNDPDELVDALAAVKELDKLHEERGKLFKLFNKAQYRKDSLKILKFKETIIQYASKATDDNYITQCFMNDPVYSLKLNSEKASIAYFVENDIDKKNLEPDEDELIEPIIESDEAVNNKDMVL